MAMYIPTTYLDTAFDDFLDATQMVVCNTTQPTTYFNACWGTLWAASTSYSVGDIVYPPTKTGHIYECTVAGTSGSTEPIWETSQDETFIDNGVTWKTHLNYSLAEIDLTSPDDFTISDNGDGRKLIINGQEGILSHEGGTVGHVVLICSTDKTLRYVNLAETGEAGSDDIEAGRSVDFSDLQINVGY